MRQIALALALALTPATAALAGSFGVPLDQSVRIALREPARQVIVGNPVIADVTVADPRHLIVTGKTGGVTNLIVIDGAGHAIINQQIVVSSVSGDHVALIKGPEVVSYACAPGCAMVGNAQSAPSIAAGGGSAASQVTAPAPGQGAVQASPTTP